jgi:DNA invertase Pin-like site-specific DNA recombinase
MPTHLRCVILAAVSSTDQVRDLGGDEKESIPYQIRRGREVIESREGWTEITEPLVVPGISRSLNWLHEAFENIEAYRQLRDLVDARKIDVVVCRAYDRLARTSVLQQQISAWLRENRVQIFAYEMPVQVQDPRTWQPKSDNTRLVVEAIAGIQSESYLNSLWSYHKFGMEGRTKKGYHPEGTAAYGYKDVVAEDGYGKSKRKRVPHPAEFPVVERIFKMLLDGKTGLYVSRWLNGDVDNPNGLRAPIPTQRGKFWTTTTLIGLARNPFYAGKTFRGRFENWKEGNAWRRRTRPTPEILVDGVHQAAVSWDDWQRVQALLTERGKAAPRLRRRDYLWSGIAVCGYCVDRGDTRNSMRRCQDHQTNLDGLVRHYNYLICSRYSYTAGRECQRNTMKVSDFTDAVFNWIETVSNAPELLEQANSRSIDDPRVQMAADLARVRAALARSIDEERQWDRAYRQQVISLEKFAEGLHDLQETRQRLELEEASLVTALSAASVADLRRERRSIALRELREHLASNPHDPDVIPLVHAVIAQVQIRDGDLVFLAV